MLQVHFSLKYWVMEQMIEVKWILHVTSIRISKKLLPNRIRRQKLRSSKIVILSKHAHPQQIRVFVPCATSNIVITYKSREIVLLLYANNMDTMFSLFNHYQLFLNLFVQFTFSLYSRQENRDLGTITCLFGNHDIMLGKSGLKLSGISTLKRKHELNCSFPIPYAIRKKLKGSRNILFIVR